MATRFHQQSQNCGTLTVGSAPGDENGNGDGGGQPQPGLSRREWAIIGALAVGGAVVLSSG